MIWDGEDSPRQYSLMEELSRSLWGKGAGLVSQREVAYELKLLNPTGKLAERHNERIGETHWDRCLTLREVSSLFCCEWRFSFQVAFLWTKKNKESHSGGFSQDPGSLHTTQP